MPFAQSVPMAEPTEQEVPLALRTADSVTPMDAGDKREEEDVHPQPMDVDQIQSMEREDHGATATAPAKKLPSVAPTAPPTEIPPTPPTAPTEEAVDIPAVIAVGLTTSQGMAAPTGPTPIPVMHISGSTQGEAGAGTSTTQFSLMILSSEDRAIATVKRTVSGACELEELLKKNLSDALKMATGAIAVRQNAKVIIVGHIFYNLNYVQSVLGARSVHPVGAAP